MGLLLLCCRIAWGSWYGVQQSPRSGLRRCCCLWVIVGVGIQFYTTVLFRSLVVELTCLACDGCWGCWVHATMLLRWVGGGVQMLHLYFGCLCCECDEMCEVLA
jgi:hypothetical protein